ncbi:MAG: sigma-70 family RNA polymerase sigma factor [Acidobacteriota bacterium]|nr:sigma-70 family RNA polymerase sigma factor [Acidobacteriota bacterium]
MNEIEQQIRSLLDQGRNAQAFELLISHFQNKVFRLAYSIVGSRSWAEDTAQDIFVRIWKALDSYRGQASLSTWIYTIARNTSLSALHAAIAKRTVSMDDPGVQSKADRAGPTQRSCDGGLDLDLLLAQLPETQRRAITLFYMEDKSYQEVARLLDLPMGTVKTYLHRARKHLAAAALESRMKKERVDAV